MDLGKDRLGPYLTTIIAPLYRELDSTYADQGQATPSLQHKQKNPTWKEEVFSSVGKNINDAQLGKH